MNEQVSPDDLVRRLEAVERQNRRLKMAGGVVCLLIVAVALAGQGLRTPAEGAQTWTQTVGANRFVLRSTTGKVLAELKECYPGEPGLLLLGPDQAPRAAFWIAEGEPALIFGDADGWPRAGVLFNATGPAIALYGSDGRPQAMLALTSTGPALSMNTADGRLLFTAP